MLLILLQYYPVSEEYIKKRSKYFSSDEWSSLSCNYNISWNESLISEYSDCWSWYHLSSNPSLPWSIDLIKRYYNKWDWWSLSYNHFLPWSKKLLNEFGYKIAHRTILSPLTLEDYIQEENYRKLQVQSKAPKAPIQRAIDTEEFKSLIDKDGFVKISNENIIWTEEVIDEYKTKLNWDFLSNNSAIPWSQQFIDKYSNKLNWSVLSRNEHLPWSRKFIRENKNKLIIQELIYNKSLPLKDICIDIEEVLNHPKTKSFVPYNILKDYRYERGVPGPSPIKIWSYLSGCSSLNWSEKLIQKYFKNWDWSVMARNPYLPWSLEFIEKYESYIDWSNLGDTLIELGLNEIIDKYKNKLNWEALSTNPNISPECIKLFANNWDWRELAFFNEGVIWTDDLINYLMNNYYSIRKKIAIN